jgi:hypothetical protein
MERPLSRWDAAMQSFLAWWEHDHVWWLPTLLAERSWRDGMGHHLAVPAHEFEHVSVIHIGTNGYTYGRGAQAVFPDRRLGTILDEWLRADSRGLFREVRAPESIVGTMPQFEEDGRVSYAEVTVPVEIDAPPGAVPKWLSWEGQLRPLFPPFTDHLPLRHLASMLTIGKEASTNADTALRRATVLASPYVQEGYSTRELAWFCPLVLERGESDGLRWVVDEATRQKLGLDEAFSRDFTQYALRDMASIDEVLGSSAWRQFLRQQIPVRRAWGPIGLFWVLLLDDLEGQRVKTAVCSRCGRMLTGKRGKQLCGPDDDPNCYRERRAEDQRRSRTRRVFRNRENSAS